MGIAPGATGDGNSAREIELKQAARGKLWELDTLGVIAILSEAMLNGMGAKGYCLHDDPIIFRFPFVEEHWDLDVPPPEVRAKIEELEGRGEFVDYDDPPVMSNIVEMIADDDDCAWDQPCAFGHRVESHAVYCHNDKWLYAPRKCRRNRNDWKHEDCRGFKPNPLLKP